MSRWRAHEIAGALPVLWAGFHLWEQWAAFAGHEAWAARMLLTSHGWTIALEIALGILPALVWMALDVRRGEPDALRGAMAEDPESARRLGWLARVAGWALGLWLLYHAGWLWLPKLTAGFEPPGTWSVLRTSLGTWPHAIAHAVGLTALAIRVWAVIPRLAIAFEAAGTPESRRAARLSGAIVATGVLLLYAQLASWHAAGHGLW